MALAGAPASGPGTLEAGELASGLEASKHAAQLKRQLTEKIRTEPAVTGRLVQSWVREPKGK